MTNLRVLFIGIGEMGSGMAGNILAKNGSLTIWNRTVPKPHVDRLTERGATLARDLKQAAGEADFICINLTSDTAVDSVAADIMERVRPGTLLMDFSTISPDSAARLAQSFAERGSFFLDCPVSGGAEGAAKGALTIMAGGDRVAYHNALPLLEMCGTNIQYMGESGLGQKAKLINQLLAWVNQSAVCEAMLLAEKSGIDLQSLYQVLETAWGRSWMLERSVKQYIIPRDYHSSASVELICKDFAILDSIARQADCGIPITHKAKEWYDRALQEGHGNQDPAVIIELMRRG